jgi:hypothetical protein
VAEPLKRHFGAGVVGRLGREISSGWSRFDTAVFSADALNGLDRLELMPRGLHTARALRRHLPQDVEEALDVLVHSVDAQPHSTAGDAGMASFYYLPHVTFVAEFGLDHFDASMRAQHAFTRRFTTRRPYPGRHRVDVQVNGRVRPIGAFTVIAAGRRPPS